MICDHGSVISNYPLLDKVVIGAGYCVQSSAYLLLGINDAMIESNNINVRITVSMLLDMFVFAQAYFSLDVSILG